MIFAFFGMRTFSYCGCGCGAACVFHLWLRSWTRRLPHDDSNDHDRDDDDGRDLVTTCVGRAAKSKGSEVDRGDILNQPLDAQNSKS